MEKSCEESTKKYIVPLTLAYLLSRLKVVYIQGHWCSPLVPDVEPAHGISRAACNKKHFKPL